jgi:hypothetical protein
LSCELPLAYRPAGAAVQIQFPARARDVSLGGIGLLVDRRSEPGQLLSLDLPGAGPTTMTSLLSSVRYCTGYGNGAWALGCSFIRDLNETELRAFL